MKKTAKHIIIIGAVFLTALVLAVCIGGIFIIKNYSVDETEVSITYDSIPTLDAEGLQQFANHSDAEYTMLYCYSALCSWANQSYPFFRSVADKYGFDFVVLLKDRATDSIMTQTSINKLHLLDSSLTRIVMLSDSLYDIEYRYLPPVSKRKSMFHAYGGPKEGNKYINYVDNYIPEGFNHDAATPKMILYKKNTGIVFVNEGYDEQEFYDKDRFRLEQTIGYNAE